jgi:hypothetical protein
MDLFVIMMLLVNKMRMEIIHVNVPDNGPVLIVQQVMLFLLRSTNTKSSLINIAPCQNALCYNGGYCDDDGKGKDGCVCVNNWLGADCRASKNRQFSLFRYLYIELFRIVWTSWTYLL